MCVCAPAKRCWSGVVSGGWRVMSGFGLSALTPTYEAHASPSCGSGFARKLLP